MNRATGNVVDSKVVELSFNNENFEKNAKQSLDTLSKLKASLKFDGASKGFDEIDRAAKRVSFDSIAQGIDAIEKRFSTFGIVGATIVMDLTRSVEKLISNTLSKVTALPRQAWQKITEGGKARAFGIENARFMLQGLFPDDLKEVEGIMNDAMDSVDGTAYAFDSAAQAASQFAASGLKAGEQMQNALKGITGVAAMTNAQYEDISRIFTTVAGNGRLMGDQLLQLSGRGLNAASTLATFFNDVQDGSEKVKDVTENVKKQIRDLGKGTKITEAEIRDFVSKGKISFDIFSEAMSTTFGEHAKDANKTFNGSLDNMQAALKRIGAKFYEPLIVQEGPLVNLFNTVRVKINEINKALDPLINALSGSVIKGIETLTNLVEGFDFQKSGFKAFIDGFTAPKVTREIWDKLSGKGFNTTPFIKALREAAAASGKVVNGMETDAQWLTKVLQRGLIDVNDLRDAYKSMLSAGSSMDKDLLNQIETLNASDESFKDLINTIAKFPDDAITHVIFGNGQYEEEYKELEVAMDKIIEKLGLTQEDGQKVVETLKGIGLFGAENADVWSNYTDDQLKALGLNEEQITSFRELQSSGKDFDEILKDIGIDLELKSGAEHFVSGVGNIFRGLVGIIGNVGSSIDSIFADANSGSVYKMLAAFDSITGSIADFITGSDTAGKTITGIASAFDLVLQAGSAVGKFVFKGVGKLLEGFNIDILGLAGNIGQAVTNFRNWIVNNNVLEDAISGLTEGLGAGIKIAKEWVGSFIDLDKAKEHIGKLKTGFLSTFSNIGDKILGARDKVKEFVKNVKEAGGIRLDNLGKTLSNLKDTIVNYFKDVNVFGPLKDAFVGIWDSITAKFKTFGIDLGFVSTAFNFLGNTATKVFNKIKSVGGNAFTVVTAFGSTFVTRFQSLFTKMQGKIQPFLEGGKAKIQEFIDKVKGIGKINLSNIGDVFKALKDTVIDYFANFEGFDAIKEAFANFWDDVKAKSKEMGVDVDWLIDGFENFGSFAGGAFDTVLNGAKGALSWLKKVWDSFRQSEIIQNAVERFSSAFTYLWNNSGTFFSGIIEKIGEFGKKVKELGGVKLSNLGDIFGAFRDSVGEYILNFDGFKMLGDAFKGLFGDINLSLKDSFGIDVEAIITGIKDLIDKIWETISNLKWPTTIGEIPEFIDSIAKSIQEFEVPESFKSLFKTVQDAEEAVGDGSKLETAEEKTVTIFDTIRSIFKVLGKIAKWIKEHFVVFVVLALGFKALKGVVEVIRDVKDLIEAQAEKLEANAFKTKMLGVLALAGAIWVLVDALNKIQNMDVGKLWGSIGALTVIFALLGGLTFAVGFKNDHYKVSAAAIMGLAAILAAIGLTLSALAILDDKEDPWKLQRIVLAIAEVFGCLLLLVGAVGAIVKWTNGPDGSNMTVAALNNLASILRTIGLTLGGLAFLDTLGLVDVSKIKTIADAIAEVMGVLAGLEFALGLSGKLFGEDNITEGLEGLKKVEKNVGLVMVAVGAVAAALGWADDATNGDLSSYIETGLGILQQIVDAIKVNYGLMIGATGLLGLVGMLDGEGGNVGKGVEALERVERNIGIVIAAVGGVSWALGAVDDWSDGSLSENISKGLGILTEIVNAIKEPMGLLIAATAGLGLIGKLFGKAALDAGAKALEELTPKFGILIGAVGAIAFVLGIANMGSSALAGWIVGKVTGNTNIKLDNWLAGSIENGLDILVTICEKIGEGVGKLIGAILKFTGQGIWGDKTAVQAFADDVNYVATTLGSETFIESITRLGELDKKIPKDALRNVKDFTHMEWVTHMTGFMESLDNWVVGKLTGGKTASEAAVTEIQGVATALSGEAFLTAIQDIANIGTQVSEDALTNVENFNEIAWVTSLNGFFIALEEWKNKDLFDGKSATEWVIRDLNTIAEAWSNEEFKKKMETIGDIDVPEEQIEQFVGILNKINNASDNGLFGVIRTFVHGATDANLDDFKTYTGKLGEAVASFTTGISGFNVIKMGIASSALADLAVVIGSIDTISMSFDYFANQSEGGFSGLMTTVAEGINSFASTLMDTTVLGSRIEDLSGLLNAVAMLNEDFKFSGDIMDDSIVEQFKTNLTTICQMVEGLKDIDTSGATRLKVAVNNNLSDLDLSALNDASTKSGITDQAEKATEGTGKAAVGTMTSEISNSSGEVSGAISGVMNDAAQNADVSGFFKIGFDIVKQIADGIRGNDSANSAIGSVALNAASTINDYFSSFHSAGAYVTSGFTSGIYSQMLEVLAAAQAIAQAAVNRIKTVIKSASPSKVTMQLGGYFGEGFEIGILKKVSDVTDASSLMAESARNGLNEAIRGVNAMLTSNLDAQPVIRPVLDLSDVQSGAATIDSIFTTAPSIGLSGNISAIDEVVAQRNQRASLDDVVTALGLVERSTSSIRGGDTYNVNGITYDDGSNISDAIRILAHEVLMDRRR